jgi:transposase
MIVADVCSHLWAGAETNCRLMYPQKGYRAWMKLVSRQGREALRRGRMAAVPIAGQAFERDRAAASASDWMEVSRLAEEGVSQREIARRLAIDRRRVARMILTGEPLPVSQPRRGSQLDRLGEAIEAALCEQPNIRAPRLTELLRTEHAYGGSVDLVRRHLAQMRAARPQLASPPGPRAGQVLELDWLQMPTRPMIGGVRRSVWALVASLPFSGAQTAYFSFDATLAAFLEGHVQVFEWLQGTPASCAYDHPCPIVAKRDSRGTVRWDRRFRDLRRHYDFSSAVYEPPAEVAGMDKRESVSGSLNGALDGHRPISGASNGSGAAGVDLGVRDVVEGHDALRGQGAPRNSLAGAVDHLERNFWPTLHFKSLFELDATYALWRDAEAPAGSEAGNGRPLVVERLREERAALRPLPTDEFDSSLLRTMRVPPDSYVRHAACFYRAPQSAINQYVELHVSRDEVRIDLGGRQVASHLRTYRPGASVPPRRP